MNADIVAIGFVVGTLVGLTGVGGGSIMTPLLVLALGVNPLVAVGTDLVYSVPTKLLGAWLHRRQGTVNVRIALALAAGGIPSAIAGLTVLSWLRAHVDVRTLEAMTQRGIGIGLVVTAVLIVAAPWLKRRVASPKQQPFAVIAAIGAFVGLIVTLTSIGSGSVTLVLLALALPSVGLAELVGSDIAFAALLIPTAAFGRWKLGDVNLPLALTLLAGSLPGVALGTALCRRLESRWLRPAVAATLVVAGVRFI